MYIEKKQKSNGPYVIIAIAVGLMYLIILCCFLLVHFVKRKQDDAQRIHEAQHIHEANQNSEDDSEHTPLLRS